ncbi:acetyltransferase [Chelativorans sp.]|uniref:acetyltransferase n=1 Tax=Chelativorans sp. TaxID=2203393 RepID=UPI002810B2DE|nr:acetyltransferase [Chelativorans sp.]
MSRSLLILGSGGHGRVVADVARASGYTTIAFLDDDPQSGVGNRAPFSVLGPMAMLEELVQVWPAAMAAIGNNLKRLELFERLRHAGYETPSVAHPSAVVSHSASMGAGVLVAPGAVINAGAHIFDAAIINTGARIDHDCTIGVASHIAPGATLSGNVSVGARSWLGTGCSVRQGVKIGDDAVIGVGAAVVTDLPGDMVYVGVPARPLRYSR